MHRALGSRGDRAAAAADEPRGQCLASGRVLFSLGYLSTWRCSKMCLYVKTLEKLDVLGVGATLAMGAGLAVSVTGAALVLGDTLVVSVTGDALAMDAMLAASVTGVAGVSGGSGASLVMDVPGVFGAPDGPGVSVVTGPVLAMLATLATSAMGVAGVMCVAGVSEATLFQGSPVSQVLLVSWESLLAWVCSSCQATPVLGAAGVSGGALVLRSTGGSDAALAASVMGAAAVSAVGVMSAAGFLVPLLFWVPLVSQCLSCPGCCWCHECPSCHGATLAVGVMSAALVLGPTGGSVATLALGAALATSVTGAAALAVSVTGPAGVSCSTLVLGAAGAQVPLMSQVLPVSWVPLGSHVPSCPGCPGVLGAAFVLGAILAIGAFLATSVTDVASVSGSEARALRSQRSESVKCANLPCTEFLMAPVDVTSKGHLFQKELVGKCREGPASSHKMSSRQGRDTKSLDPLKDLFVSED
ncbi:hypothetical protein MJG53_003138 [Ovis ammon polii x Ovis aries]|uniref:Uncharacterized protein n=1 Tax=Ovis ammon polii x Ovis aries TaxID=2918886 RepID=A0ACB9VGY7_9CETA|nr:hypothetical protein MJG53_003138 [Ovis ammon polii x Ovis aries]